MMKKLILAAPAIILLSMTLAAGPGSVARRLTASSRGR